MTYGVTPTGLVRPSLQELLDERQADQRSSISQGLDQSPESPLGQINAIGCRQLGVAWEALDIAHNGFDADRAEDFLLTALAKLTGTWREPATKSTTPCTVNLDADTVLIAGEHFARVAGKPNVRFTPRENITASAGDGDYEGVFEAEVTGPVAVGSNQLTVIATSVVGWNSVTNPNPAILGTVEQADPSLREKREQQLAAAGNQTAAAIRADLLALRHDDIQWVKSVEVFENDDNAPDGEGRPAHTFEVLVYDSEFAPDDADDQIAQVIWRNKPGGIKPWGYASEQGDAVTENGQTVVVPFSRVSLVPIYITMTLTTVAGYAGSTAVKDAVVTQAGAKYDLPGSDVIALFVKGIPLAVAGVADVPVFTLGTAPAPVGTVNLPISVRQVATFDVARIAIT